MMYYSLSIDSVFYQVLYYLTLFRQYFASNVNPLWTKCYSSSVDIADREKRIYNYLQVG